ncbi:MAG: Obg family GTPase CgtA [Parcubacteria group bacterium GW2011_GWC1_40_13]|nr:MAG: Obg family GTPase CgtA [Parcubacteria group bacterium GW2011_GWC1_40_13]
MAFIDELKVHIKAGTGGNGVVRWRHLKGKEYSGAAGGDGGKGSNAYVKALRDVSILARYKNIKNFEGENGEDGMKDSKHGKSGKDLIIELPIGSVITNLSTGRKVHLLKEGETILLLKGGNGGYGNEHFKASTNVTPKQSTKGKQGEEADFLIELELIADAGFVGLPNAGKSSLLNELTKAKSKVGSYAFTTLEPYLGDMEGFILADIPGLIEGASEGKGLGHKFLRHIKRTKTILHCISVENEDIRHSYNTIRKELENYDADLVNKKEIVILTKTDLVDSKFIDKAIKEISKENPDILSVTVYDNESIKELKDSLIKIIRSI